jgi:transcription antitermination factor NusA-like protein
LQKRDGLAVIVRPEQLSLGLALKGKVVQLVEDYLKVKIKILTWEEINKENVVIIEAAGDLKNSLNTKMPDYKLYGE